MVEDTTYTVLKRLELPPDLGRYEIDPSKLEAAGLITAEDQSIKNLAELSITGTLIDRYWEVTAWHKSNPKNVLGEIKCESGTGTNQIIPTAAKWIDESRHAFILRQGEPVRLPVENFLQNILVRGSFLVFYSSQQSMIELPKNIRL